MTPQELRLHKLAAKVLKTVPEFKPLKKGKLPRPFHRMGGGRITSTGLVDVAADYSLFFLVKDGSTLQDTHFYGYLMHKLEGGGMSPLFEFHWHPSHKGFHCKTPCRTTSDYTDRTLPSAPELKMKTKVLDPRKSQDRQGLVAVVCEACGVTLRSTDDFGQMDIWH